MKKSPARWIKRVLFGRKSRSLRKRKAQKAARDDLWVDGQGRSTQEGVSPVISHPLRVTSSISINTEGEKTSLHTLQTNVPLILEDKIHQQDNVAAHIPKHVNRDREAQGPDIRSGQGRVREELAAVKIQALFKGYRARKAFHALQSIISLQSLIRGQLVRSQALATLFCINGIIKLQALVRGQQVRLSGPALRVSKTAVKDIKYPDTPTATKLLQKKNLSSHNFIYKLIPSVHIAKPLQSQYAAGEPNSVWIWLERWNSSHFWKPILQTKKTVDLKSNARRGSNSRQAGSGILKRNNWKGSSAKTNTRSKTTASLPDKRKQQVQKGASSSANKVRGQQPNEQAKVAKRSSKKPMSPSGLADQVESKVETMQSFSIKPSGHPLQADGEMETSMLTSGSDALVVEHTDSAAKMVNALSSPERQLETPPWVSPLHATPCEYLVETIRKPHVDILILHENNSRFPVETNPEQATNLDVRGAFNIVGHDDATAEANTLNENQGQSHLPRNKWISSNGEQHSLEILAAIKTASNQIEDSPLLSKSYMASTASTKAKLRGQGSPKVSPGVVDKNDFTQRHSPQPSRNGRLSHKVGQPVAKRGPKSEKALSSARDKNDKSIQPEWRR